MELDLANRAVLKAGDLFAGHELPHTESSVCRCVVVMEQP